MEMDGKLRQKIFQLKKNKDNVKMTIKEFVTNFDSKSRYYSEGGIETLDVIKAKLTSEQYKGYLLGNAIKYQCRMNFKGVSDNDKLRDAEKAANYTAWLRDAMMQSGITIGQKLHDNVIQETKKTTEVYKDIKLAISVLTENMQADSELAWGWHCNIAMPFMDEDVEHDAANKGAARVMYNLFKIDMTKHDRYRKLVTNRYNPVIENQTVVKNQKTMDFSTALESIKNGKKIARLIWNQGIVMFMTEEQYTNSESDNLKVGTLIYATVDGLCLNWFASHADMFAEDWIIME